MKKEKQINMEFSESELKDILRSIHIFKNHITKVKDTIYSNFLKDEMDEQTYKECKRSAEKTERDINRLYEKISVQVYKE